MKSVKFHINNEGNVTVVDVCGTGMNCQAFTADVEAALGKAQEGTRQATDNMYKPVERTLDVDQG